MTRRSSRRASRNSLLTPTMSTSLSLLVMATICSAFVIPPAVLSPSGATSASLLSSTIDTVTLGGTIKEPIYLYDGFPRLASMVGWLSIACWVVVYTPQLWLCVVQQSGEGLSLIFLVIWLAGDITNLLGTFWQGLLPTMIVLAAYYSISDIILIFQVFYYRRKRALYPQLYLPPSPLAAPMSGQIESDPLMSSFSAHAPSSKTKKFRDIVSYVGGLAIVVAVGVVAWWLSRSTPQGRRQEVWDTKAQVVGWISAFLYLGSRLPQIAKNRETKCHGLSLLMFAFSVAGNTTYVASILLQSFSAQHLLINASWLLGSGGTIFLDFIVLGQFWWYASARRDEGKIFLDDDDDDIEGIDEA